MAEENNEEKVNEADLKKVEERLVKSELYSQVQVATGRFLSEFASFEAVSMAGLLSAVARDIKIIENLVDLIGLRGKLVLLQRLMKERAVQQDIVAEVEEVLTEAKRLESKRNDIAHSGAVLVSATFEAGKPGDLIGGVRVAPGKRRPLPAGGFVSQAHMETWMRQNMHTVSDLEKHYDDAIALNHRAWTLAAKLRSVMGRGPAPP